MFPQSAQYPTPVPQGSWSQSGYGPWTGHPMMWWSGGNQNVAWFGGLLWLVTWILVIVVLVALARWLWKKGDKVK